MRVKKNSLRMDLNMEASILGISRLRIGTDGMYGDYPDDGYDGDFDFMG